MKKSFLPLTLAIAIAGCATNVRAVETIHLEAEDGQLSGATVDKARTGFSGTGYVTGFKEDKDTVRWTIPSAKAGIYTVTLRYSADDNKGFGVIVNGSQVDGTFLKSGGKFATHTMGKVELKEGENTVSIAKGWGWYDIDYIELLPTSDKVVALPKPPATLVDKKATKEARDLMAMLVANYGQKMLSGQYDSDVAYVREITGQDPAIVGVDLMDYSPSRVARGSKSTATEQAIKAHKAGQVVTISWHWNAPTHLIDKNYTDKNGKKVEALWWSGFYTRATTFDVEKALANPNSKEYKLLLSDIDVIAVQLKRLDAAKVPVLWRPLHEADGAWFWWGAKGADPFKKLWRLMFDRLTNKHNLHNLIWVYTGTPEKPDWYPGDDVVDIYGVDSYPADRNDPLSGTWEALRKQFDGKKLLALSEFKGAPDVLKMERYGVKWSYFVAWTGGAGTRSQDKAEVKRAYDAPNVINLEDLKR